MAVSQKLNFQFNVMYYIHVAPCQKVNSNLQSEKSWVAVMIHQSVQLMEGALSVADCIIIFFCDPQLCSGY